MAGARCKASVCAGHREAISCSSEKMYHRKSRNSGNFTEVRSVSALELVRVSLAERRL